MKKDRLLIFTMLLAAVGVMVFFYFFAFKPFETRKGLIYIKSDFLLSQANFSGLENSFSILQTDNTVPIDHSGIYAQIEYIRLESISNINYIKTSGNADTGLGTLLTNYYNDIQFVTEKLKPKVAFAEFMDRLNSITEGVEAVSASDNYEAIADFINQSLQTVGTTEAELDDSVISNYPEVKEIAAQYLLDIEDYYTAMIPLVRSVPEYIAKNDRDQTRIIMAEIEALSAQYKANEANLDQMAMQYFQESNSAITSAVDRINSNQLEITNMLAQIFITD